MNPDKISAKGAVLIEAAIFFAVMIPLYFSAFSLAFNFRAHIYAINLANVAGQGLYRDCRFEIPTKHQSCLDKVKTIIETIGNKTGFPTTVTLSVYQDMTFNDPLLAGTETAFSNPVLYIKTTGPSNFSRSSFENSNLHLYKHFELNGQVWIAEVRVKVPFQFFGIGLEEAYESAIT